MAKDRQELCDTRFKVRPEWKRLSPTSLKHLVLDWFRFWRYEFDYDKTSICIRSGGVVSSQRHESMSNICVIDPFIVNKNVTKNIPSCVLAHFLKECERGFKLLHRGRELEDVLAS